jgi:hypothetical protein
MARFQCPDCEKVLTPALACCDCGCPTIPPVPSTSLDSRARIRSTDFLAPRAGLVSRLRPFFIKRRAEPASIPHPFPRTPKHSIHGRQRI